MENGESSYRRFLEGDEDAFDAILKTYRTGLTLFINRYVHNADTAEDLAIDTFTELLLHPNRYNFKTSLKTYLFMIGHSKAIDYLRKNRNITAVELSDELPDGARPLEDAVIAGEQKRAVHLALRELPEEMRIAVHLVYFEELSYEETAKVMKKNRKQVDNLLYRAKERLRQILGRGGNLL